MLRDRNGSSVERVAGLVVAVLVCAAVSINKFSSINKNQLLQSVFCSQYPGFAGQLCSSYHDAVGSDKFTAAAHWRQLSPESYACSGITVECLQADMRSQHHSSSSSCQPLGDGQLCDKQQQLTCSKGFCGGVPTRIKPADPNFKPGMSSGFAPVGFAAPQQHQQRWQHSQHAFTSAKDFLSTLLTSAHAKSADSSDAAAAAPRTLQSASAQANPSWPTAYGIVKLKDGGRRVPETFLATSHEWTRLTDYGGESASAWAEIFKVLGPSPVLRIGGATQDKLIDPPKDDTWIALAQLQKLTNARYIIGLPLFQKNAVEMSQQMIGRAKKYLGSSVIGYELGNEPEFWPNGLGGYDEQGNWKSGFAAYTQWFDRVARILNPCGTKPFLSGPGWGNLNTQDPNWLKIVLANGNSCGYLWEANAHYYPYIDNTTVTADQLLSQPLQDVGLGRLGAYVKIAQEGHSLPLRISEANSLYGGGRAGLSDTMAGTLWVADALFAFAAGGARAFHLHWGHGGLPYQGGSPNVGVQTNFDYNTPFPYKPYPSVHAPWYAYLFWVSASAGGYGKNADTQFVSSWIEKPAAATPAPASVVTEKGDKPASNSSSSQQTSNKRIASAEAMKAYWRQQTSAHSHGATAAADAAGRKLLAAKQTAGSCEANMKLWALKAGDTLRLAVLNKDSGRDCNIRISIPDAASLCKPGQKAELSRLLPGPGGMSSKSGLSWQGQHYEDSSVASTGKLVGARATSTVTAIKDAGGCAYIFSMPRTSAALLIVKA